ncbi:MAG: DUF2946 domain-containing protein [Mesorhizobium sp.]|uniref:DUF2946 family protein n=1 Tax=unclassified Mesorhizobium TaxID=325217 RepID=UPI000F7505B3|nr:MULTISPECIES: DUF2946 family protein [unclassified Mesorhizobium]AZO52069.1 DUF2946 domain-containing protein [Mesorhizobium sp. M4B.F.Ca.ET.058.02.1.1]RVC47239.1 DUF2946 domain-containing protein [Mesorhizobium sp. M4A.F.Ca.ET.090.04.2.1]RWC54118.1 MAG: DUF2946 domain-containing protein [Mesorhizobium sp.]RWD08051.1 MAG: DUF2946 domain-containing protein [Mesorhizobium sp.]RWD18335.1 MAG: DUF2946 domain-containing protein [Mesorhizobium sp.]
MRVAFVAILVLVLQSALGAFAAGPAAAQLDAFGNVICTHEGATQLPSSDPHQQHMPACCVLGCSMVSATHAPPPDASVLVRSLVLEAVVFAPPAFTHVDFARDRSPSNPRAPPATA